MKKILIALILFASMLLTSCSASAPDVSIGKNGHWWIDGKDSGISARGDRGEKGETGAQGAQGARGKTGEKGDTGAQGAKGDTGADGQDGVTPKLKVGEDNLWYVSYDDGTSWTSLGVRATGEKGETGAQGEKGDKGETGATGAQGEKGDPGDPTQTGAQGEKGDKGDKGDRGEKGNPGDTPYIGENGHWWIGAIDTGVPAREENMTRTGSDGLLFRTTIRGGVAGYEVFDYIGEDTDIVIPDAIFDQPVISIAQDALPTTITSLSIGTYTEWLPSFRNYQKLVSFDFNHAPVDTTAEEMFYRCWELATVENYENLRHITDNAFYGTMIVNFDFSAVESIGDGAFDNCQLEREDFFSALTQGFIFLPKTVLSVGENAFDDRYIVYYEGECPHFDNIKFVSNVKCSSDGYYYLDDGETVTLLNYFGEESRITPPAEILGKPVTSLGTLAFSRNYTIERVEIPSSVRTVGKSAFSLAKNLHSIFVPDSVTDFGTYTSESFDYLRVGFEFPTFYFAATTFDTAGGMASPDSYDIVRYKTGVLPESIEDDNVAVYQKNANTYEVVALKNIEGEITIPAEYQGLPVTRINKYALYGETRTASIVITDGIVKISSNAFYDSRNLKKVVVPSSVTTVNYLAFYELYYCVVLIDQTAIPEDWDSSWSGSIGGYYLLGTNLQVEGDYLYEVEDGHLYLSKYIFPIEQSTPIFLPTTLAGMPVYGVRSLCFETKKTSYSNSYIFVIPSTIKVMESQAINLYGYGYCTLYMDFASADKIPDTWESDWLDATAYGGALFTSSYATKYYRGTWELVDGVPQKMKK